MRAVLPSAFLALAAFALPAPADAFCGFYVSGADSKLYNNATLVVLMRDGTRTVLSMQNNYQGPPDDFAMVVPVPVVLAKENVKTLPAEVFGRVDRLAAPRLVEYWEQDPCFKEPVRAVESVIQYASKPTEDEGSAEEEAERHGVKIEARFNVGEYNVLILSARDSLGLDTFLRGQRYKIPAGAEPYLRPYVTAGSKFFVAKVDAKKIRFENGQAMLSPLRFHYDGESFNLPVRLGLINSAGTQDLIVHVLARSRYEVANYENYAIPTNIRVKEPVKQSFGSFYATLFDKVLEKHPRAVMTEYAWDAGSCDPCPEPPLGVTDLASLGADVLPAYEGKSEAPPELANAFTLTRLHVRYDKNALGEDLVFRAAPPIRGGNGVPDPEGRMEPGAMSSGNNSFQGRYVILHPWEGPIECKEPRRGIWGGPVKQIAGAGTTQVATNTAFAPRDVELASFLDSSAGVLESQEAKLPSGPVTETPLPTLPSKGGCASCTTASSRDGLEAVLGAVAAAVAIVLRRGSTRAKRGAV
ncbi:DUF2330 domain-containing protein [Polyangium jinanense]|uniref:DUF2330 domain-containing protein n=1 Tax=Polyangium jinanense TaxID=2829994 RepID=A0A9X3X5I1_9BACT|nr:DUF2330 domain-containing protein [Polyangium jinanense]MDC3955420.1 DUF2330 domain-containing protein [Polyangium jinanense]MDC3981721.1 DUF2330 domain-containing protein [Polyangium jinanense]